MKSFKCLFGFHDLKLTSYQNGMYGSKPYLEYYHYLNYVCIKCGKIKVFKGRGNLTHEKFINILKIQNDKLE